MYIVSHTNLYTDVYILNIGEFKMDDEQNTDTRTTITILQPVKDRLNTYKIIPAEAHHHLIIRLLDELDELRLMKEKVPA